MCASLHVGSRGLASGLTAVPVCAGVRARQITELCFAMQPGLAERAHVDYHLMASVFGAAAREGRRTRVYVIDGAGMLCVATLERVLAGSCAQVHTALAGIDVCSATALDGMLVCIRRVRALVMASLGKYALVLVYGLSQHVPAPAACTASQMLQWVNAVETLGTLSRQGNVAVVLANGVWALPQGNVYVGHSLNDATARAKLASAGSADVVLVRANGEGVLQRKRFVAVCTSKSSPQQDSSLALPSLSR